jgi:hypothetical protein
MAAYTRAIDAMALEELPHTEALANERAGFFLAKAGIVSTLRSTSRERCDFTNMNGELRETRLASRGKCESVQKGKNGNQKYWEK